jgi:hypothetical protein
MYGVRLAISAFILLIIGVLLRGWVWTAAHQPAPQATASHVVLTIGIIGSVIGLAALWRPRAKREALRNIW